MIAVEQGRTVAPPFQGLSEEEVLLRRARGEGNAVPFETSRTYKRILLQNASSFINTVLFVIVVLLLVLGLPGDAVMTAGLVVANVVVGVFQEGRAKRQLDRIALLTRPTATVIRNGRERTVDPGEIVRGDLIVVRPGDQILVDGAVASENEISVDESLLTGESDHVLKHRGDAVYSGSFCITGSAVYQAEKVGAGSIAQQITAGARTFREVKTPLQREIGLVIKVMIVLVVGLSVQVGNSFRDVYGSLPLADSVRAAAVIVALVPQGLAFMITVTYALAAVRMAGKGALIQRMNAIESSSHIDVLCLDKTGTLTTNNLALHDLKPFGIDAAELRRRLGDYASATTAGNRTTAAIAAACPGTAGRHVREEVPFSSDRKWSALSFDDALRGVYVLGAPEILQPALAPGTDIDEAGREWTAHGLRVVLFAWHPDVVPLRDSDGRPRLTACLVPLGLLAFRDELRPEAGAIIKQFGEAGVALKIISGDSPDTVAALARQAGLDPGARAVAGPELDGLDGVGLEQVVEQTTVFGRITPRQKERLVQALRQRGHYVAMTGDGVNDVLALKQADLAIAMRSGSQITRSVADIVLLDDSFAVLPATFREGQRIMRGMEDIIRLFLSRTLYVALLILAASVLDLRFPVTPKQNGVLALLTVGIPTFALALWARPGTSPRRLLPSAAHFVVPAGLTIAAVSLTVYHFILTTTGDVNMARSALTTTTVLCGLLLIPFVQPPTEAWTGGTTLNGDWRPTILAVTMLALYGVILFYRSLRRFYELGALPLSGYVLIALVVLGWAVGLRWLWRLQPIERLRALRRRRAARMR